MASEQTRRVGTRPIAVRDARPVPMKARRTLVADARTTMTRVFRTRSSGLVAEFGR